MLGIFSLGAAIVIMSGGIDLSAGSTDAVSGTVCATLMLLNPTGYCDPRIASPLRDPGWWPWVDAAPWWWGFLVGRFHASLIKTLGNL